MLIFAGVAVLVIAIVMMTCKYQNTRKEKERAAAEYGGPAISSAQPENSSRAKYSRNCGYEAPCWYILFAWPEGITAWAIILTFAVIGWQADETRKAAIAAKESAEAALKQTDYIVAAERAWLLLDGEKTGQLFLVPAESQPSPKKQPIHCQITFKNSGNTPAHIVDWQFDLRIGDSSMKPPSLEVYDRKPSEDRETPFPVGKDSVARTVAVLEPKNQISIAEKEEIDSGSKFLWLSGIVRYQDVFEQHRLNSAAGEHQTLICLRYVGGFSPWVIGGPSGYNKAK